MKTLLMLILTTSSAHAALPDWVASSSSCSQKVTKIELDPPSADTGEKISLRCAKSLAIAGDKETKYTLRTGGKSSETKEVKGTCNAAYQFLNHRHQFYKQVKDVCKTIDAARAENEGKSATEVAAAVLAAARASVQELSEAISEDITAAEKLRLKTFEVASQEHNNFNARITQNAEIQRPALLTKSQVSSQVVTKAKDQTEISTRGQRNDIAQEALNLPAEVKTVGENIAARTELTRFVTQLKSQQASLQATARSLGLNTTRVENDNRNLRTLNEETKPGSSISGTLKDLLPFAPLALMAGTMAMQQQNAKKAADSAGAGLTPQPGDVSGREYGLDKVKNAETASLKPRAQGGSLEKDKTGASKLEKPNADESELTLGGGQSADPISSSASGYAPAPKAFSGALENNPIFGTASSGGPSGGGSSSSGESRKPGSLDEVLKLDKNSVPSNTYGGGSGGGGGMPAFAGGNSSGGSDAGLKDMFKLDPLPPFGAPPSAENTVDTAQAFSPFEGFSEGAAQGGLAVPGADDVRTLFVRVKDYHVRCQKKGCVTNEAGGKL
jgi:hypothetical protein